MTNVVHQTSVEKPVIESDNLCEEKTNFHSSAFTDSPPIIVASESDFSTYGISGEGSLEHPFMINDLRISLNEAYPEGHPEGGIMAGIYIQNIDSYITIENCIIHGRYIEGQDDEPRGLGIFLEYVRNARIFNCTFVNLHKGVMLGESNGTEILESTFRGVPIDDVGMGVGVDVQSHSDSVTIEGNSMRRLSTGITLYRSDRTFIHENEISKSTLGIKVSYNSTASLISNNTCFENSQYGIGLSDAVNTTIINNNCSYNTMGGIFVSNYAFGCVISLNSLLYNGIPINWSTFVLSQVQQGCGIRIYEGSTGNTVEWNDFIGNGINARNDVDGNTYEYNYYSDYTGVDENNDLFGDSPYDIDGDSPTQDTHPRISLLGEVEYQTTTSLTNSTTGTTTQDQDPSFDFLAVGIVSGVLLVGVLSVIMISKRR